MDATYEKQLQIEMMGGETEHIEIDFPHRGRISKLMVRQVTGVVAGFSVDLYNSVQPKRAADNGSRSSASAADTFNDGTYKILPTQTTASDAIEVFEPSGYPYRNVDGTFSVPIRKLYLRIQANGTGEKTFEVALASLHQQ